VFAFGFDTRIKTISPLINWLINDALLYSRPYFNNWAVLYSRFSLIS